MFNICAENLSMMVYW